MSHLANYLQDLFSGGRQFLFLSRSFEIMLFLWCVVSKKTQK